MAHLYESPSPVGQTPGTCFWGTYLGGADRDEPGGAGTASFYGESVAGRLTDMVGDGVISRTWFIVHHHPDQSYSGAGATSN